MSVNSDQNCFIISTPLSEPSGYEDVEKAGDGVDGVKKDVQTPGQVSLHEVVLHHNCNNIKLIPLCTYIIGIYFC
jgi:hypothetical protein